MSKVAVFVVGPAGVGKSTFCSSLILHAQDTKRAAHLVNLDPAAENFTIEPSLDVRNLITLEDVMEELDLGPNGGLIYCMEYLLENIDWLEESLEGYESDFLFIDCPGQIELYTHYQIMRQLIRVFEQLNYRCISVYLLESQFIQDTSKYFAGVLNAMATMVQLEIPHINVLTKIDLLMKQCNIKPTDDTEATQQAIDGEEEGEEDNESEEAFYEQYLGRYLEPDPTLLHEGKDCLGREFTTTNDKFFRLNKAIIDLIEDFNLVSFLPLNITKHDSIERIMLQIDTASQYSESLEPMEQKSFERDDDYLSDEEND